MVSVSAKAEVDIVKSLSGSPTSTLRNHLLYALYNGTQLGSLTKMVLVDTAGSERDYTTTLNFTVGDSLVVQGTITVTASYTIAKVRLYSGTNLYFDTPVSEQKAVSPGDTVTATVTITLSGSGSLTGYTYVLDQLRPYFYDVLRGARTASALDINKIRIYIRNVDTGQTLYYDQTPSESIDTTNLRLTMSVSITPDYTWETRNIEIYAGAARLWYWNLTGTPKGGSPGTTLSYSETVSV
ncbi:MAG: hypothetical protein QXE66_02315 [Desulfurococcaceae archaeon]